MTMGATMEAAAVGAAVEVEAWGGEMVEEAVAEVVTVVEARVAVAEVEVVLVVAAWEEEEMEAE